MDPRDFHHLASRLVNENNPASLRTAISRAYYATFNVGAEILKNMGFTIPVGPSAHGEMRNYLSNSGNKEVSIVASQIASLHRNRINADYRLDNQTVENPKTALAIVKQAEKMILALDSECSGHGRTKIISEIEKYKKLTNQ